MALDLRFVIAILGLVAACVLAAIITLMIQERSRSRETQLPVLTYEEL